MQKRFYVAQSRLYGLTVYDRVLQMPAYDACCYLPRTKLPDGGEVAPACTQLDSDVKAVCLALRLNRLDREGV